MLVKTVQVFSNLENTQNSEKYTIIFASERCTENNRIGHPRISGYNPVDL